jgi:hypothetical protein
VEWVPPIPTASFAFPFLFLSIIGFAFGGVSYHVNKKQTQVLQVFLTTTGVMIFAGLFFECAKATVEDKFIVGTSSILLIIGYVIINIGFAVTFFYTVDDYQFNEYRKY